MDRNDVSKLSDHASIVILPRYFYKFYIVSSVQGLFLSWKSYKTVLRNIHNLNVSSNIYLVIRLKNNCRNGLVMT